MKITVRCVGCGATREVGDKESTRLSKDKDVPLCKTCYMPMVAVSARGKVRKK